MKKIYQGILTIAFIFLFMLEVHAAPSTSFYTSSKYVESGSSVTATLRLTNTAAWNVKISSSGATSGCTTSFADATSNGQNTTKYLTVTCRATSTGTIYFSASGDATSSDGSTSNISTSASVTVTAPREKDSNNYLKSLSIKDYQITPEFNKETLEYSVTVPNTIEKVTLEGEAESRYASITGLGEVEVSEGKNAFDIKVLSETGVERIYKIVVNVEDENPIEKKIKDNTYTIMKNVKTIEPPKTYTATSIKIDNYDIPAFYSEISKYTLVGVRDNKGDSHLAIYDEKENTFTLYNETTSQEIFVFVKEPTEDLKGFKRTTKTINGESRECYVSNIDESIIVVYAMNIDTGENNYYYYDETNNTYTLYHDEIETSYAEQIEKYKMVILIFGGALVLFFLIIIILIFKRPKRKKKIEEIQPEIKVKEIKKEVKDEISSEKEKEPQEKPKKEKHKKKAKEKKEKETKIEPKVEEKKEEPKEEKKPEEKKNTKKSKEEALEQVNNATKIIEDYEKTIQLSKDELKKKKEELEKEETMYDIFEDERKRKRK